MRGLKNPSVGGPGDVCSSPSPKILECRTFFKYYSHGAYVYCRTGTFFGEKACLLEHVTSGLSYGKGRSWRRIVEIIPGKREEGNNNSENYMVCMICMIEMTFWAVM